MKCEKSKTIDMWEGMRSGRGYLVEIIMFNSEHQITEFLESITDN